MTILLGRPLHTLIGGGTVELENETEDANTGRIVHEWPSTRESHSWRKKQRHSDFVVLLIKLVKHG